MRVIHRTQHRTLIDIDGKGARRAVIGNHSNYKTPQGVWLPTVDEDLRTLEGRPADWVGAFDYSLARMRGPVQTFMRDRTDAANSALAGMRDTARPQFWFNWKAVGVDQQHVVPRVPPGGRRVVWDDLWTDADLIWYGLRHKVKSIVRIKSIVASNSYRFSLRIPEGMSYELANGILYLRDSDTGAVVFNTQPITAEDATGSSLRCGISQGQDITVGPRTYPTFVLTVNADDLAGASFPVLLDPTTTLSGTASIEDAQLSAGANANKNYGGRTDMGVATPDANSLIRFDETEIPEGTITALRYIIYVNFAQAANEPNVVDMHKIAAANYDWPEGNGNGGTGGCCYNQKEFGVANWAGGAGSGCDVSGTDYVADGSPPSLSLLGTDDVQYQTWDATPEWAEDWRDNPTNNGGVVMLIGDRALTHSITMATTEAASNNPSIEIDYQAGPQSILGRIRQRSKGRLGGGNHAGDSQRQKPRGT